MSGLWLLLCLLLLEKPLARPPFFALGNRCGSPRTSICDFVCDCWDCSDESWCGYRKDFFALGTPFTCDFEGSTCGWEDVSTTGYRWAPARASLSTWGAEPPFDHTLGTDLGWFMSTSKQRAKPSAIAQLRSPPMRAAAATCEIRAWYHLWGPGLDKNPWPALTVELSRRNHTVTLWRNPPSSVYAWRELVAYTGRIEGTFQITFTSTQEFSETVQLAIDDVEFRNCGLPRPQNCSMDEYQCQQGGCVAKDRLCDGTKDCRDGEDESHCDLFSFCSFEEDWCGWTVEPGTTFSWARNTSLQVPPSSAQPTRDHSTNSRAGYFVYVSNANLDLQERKAWLVSPTLAANQGRSCHLVLYLHLHGADANSLNIYYRTETGKQLVRVRSGDLGNYWFRETAHFNMAEEFQIVIEGVIGKGHKENIIALDDLILSPGCLKQNGTLSVTSQPDVPSPCSPDQFACDDGNQCISMELVCDFKAECHDGSDELRCGATDFALGPGGWTDVSVGRLQWRAQQSNGSSGSFFSLQEGPGQMLSLARAATPVLGPSGLACALEIDFTTGPQGLLALAIADERLGTHRVVWYTPGNGTTAWERATVPLGSRDRPFQLELLGLEDLRGPHGSLLGIGNVTFVNCNANDSLAQPSGLSCNFETDWCEWFMEQSDGFEWERRANQGWGVDHTTGTGSFLSVDPSAPGTQGLRARLISSLQASPSYDTCLSFWYRMEGPQIGTLNLIVRYAGEPEQVLWTRKGSHGMVWHRGFSTMPQQPGQNYQVIFEALRDGFLGTMALDDITVTPGACRPQKHCSFETDNCGFSISNQQAWERQNGAGGQGPPVDHTLGTPKGHYLFINTSVDALPSGQRAALWSPPAFLPWLRTHCVTFWYYLSSSDARSLSAYVKEGGTQREVLIMSMMQAEAWLYGNFTVTVQDEWQVAFVVEGAGGGPSSYFALDDFEVKEGSCREAGSCNFELGPCGWRKPHGDWYSWDWKDGATPSQSSSPKVDHILGTKAGHYAYVDVAVLGMGRGTARLASEPLPPTDGACLHFYYHMDFLGQSSEAELRVLLSGQEGERTVWHAVGHQSRGWMNQSLFVSSLTNFQIVLEATSGAWPSSETIAVDDISYTAGAGCDKPQGSQEEGSSSAEDSVAGLVAGIVCSILFGLVAAISTIYCLKKQKASGARMPEETASIQGFDNIAFRDDRVMIPQLPIDRETE
ncbi:apical endosomal glycoprotein [Rhineura floridana]|uniref:apical endosomal glycoprotein n=1 Tax=Rhineura floridana TaxID=261503 RepID=UPI002AC7E7BE|nr:apical endosomal glycoprotein [Rhineura floridana]